MIRKSDNHAVLIDFGIARKLDPENKSDYTKTSIGTIGYMSPEQYEGKPVFQSDIYSLGATMHHLLTGKQSLPFIFSSLKKLNKNISEKTDAIVMTSLRNNPEERFKTALEFKEALTGIKEVSMPQENDEERISLLLLQAKVPDNNVRKYFVKALGEMESKKTINPLVEIITEDSDEQIRITALKSLVKFKEEKEVKKIFQEKAVKDRSSLVREFAVKSIAEWKDEEFVESLIKALDDKEDIKIRAISGLRFLKTTKALEGLKKIFQEKEGLIKEEAFLAIEHISPKEAGKLKKRDKDEKKIPQKPYAVIILAAVLIITTLICIKYLLKDYKINNINKHLTGGFKYIDENRLPDAREEFKKALNLLEKYPLSSEKAAACYGLGLTYYQEKKWTEGKEKFKEAIQYNSEYGKAYLYLGKSLMEEKDYENAIIYLEKGREIIPEEPDIYISLSRLYHLTGHDEKAGVISEAYRLNFPDTLEDNSFIAGLINEGIHKINEKQYTEAIKCFEAVLEITPENADGYYGLGMVYMKLRDKQKSAYYLSKALEYAPRYTDAIIALAELNYDFKNYSDAISYCNEGLALSPATGKLYMIRGLSHYNMGNNNEALVSLDKYLKIEPDGKNTEIIKEVIEKIKTY